MRTSTRDLVIDEDKSPIGIIITDAEFGRLTAKQLRQAIRNRRSFGGGDPLIVRMPNGQYATVDNAYDDFKIVSGVKIYELGGTAYTIAKANDAAAACPLGVVAAVRGGANSVRR